MFELGAEAIRPYTREEIGTGAFRVATITSEQVRAARAMLRWEQRDLAKATGLAVITIKTIEGRPGRLMVRTSTLYALQEVFAEAGIEFFDGDNGGAGVRFKRGER